MRTPNPIRTAADGRNLGCSHRRVSAMRKTHIVTQTAPDGTATSNPLWDKTDADAVQWCRDMKADNLDYSYTWERAALPPLKLTAFGQALVDSTKSGVVDAFMILGPSDVGNQSGNWEVVERVTWDQWYENENAAPSFDYRSHETQDQAEADVRELGAKGLTTLPQGGE